MTLITRVVTRLNIGGVGRHVQSLHQGADPSAFESRLIVGTPPPEEGALPFQFDDPRVAFVPELQRSVDPLRDRRAYARIADHIRSSRPGIVDTHMAKSGALGRLAARRAKVPVIIHTYHGHVLDQYFSKATTRAFTLAERRLAGWSDALIAVSSEIRDELIALGIGTPDQWHVIPYGLELDELAGSSVDPAQARETLHLPAGRPVVGIVGRLVPIKDHETFLQAAGRVRMVHPDAFFVIAGDGELRADLELRAAAILGDGYLFTGWVEDLPTLYSSLDVIVLTSRNEGTPFALIEGAACGLPSVATDVGGVAAAVVDGTTGHLVPARDPSATAAAIGRLLAQPQDRETFGRKAREHVLARFGVDRMVRETEALYTELLERKRAG